MEAKYTFRERLENVHLPITGSDAGPQENEVALDNSWKIVIPRDAGIVLQTVALDLQDYLKTAFNLDIEIQQISQDQIFEEKLSHSIYLAPSANSATLAEKSSVASCQINCDRQSIKISAVDEKQVARGCYALESMLNLRRAPYLKPFEQTLANRFSPRMVHSGWALDVYPENYLRKIAHSGFDSILIYYRRSDVTSEDRIKEINGLIDSAEKYGIGVYLYFQLYREYDVMHPTEPGAEEYYDSFYGRAFVNHPKAAGCVMVGESCSFPSRDSATNGGEATSGSSKPHPGWWPCFDYPDWLRLVQKLIVRQKPDADLVFWTYNWGWAPKDKRLELIKNLPAGTTLLVTFEMFELLPKGEIQEVCADYTIKFEGPGQYFTSEAKAAKERNIKLYAMSNTGGLTWDFGVVPYIPAPFQWVKRWKNLLAAHKKWGLSGLMESHHYGFYPSYISKLGEYFATSEEADKPQEFLAREAESFFGISAGRRLLKAWELWSNAIPLLPATAYDQYGPLRIGPSYPFYLKKENADNLPSDPGMIHGNSIVVPFYAPENFFNRNKNAAPIDVQIAYEVKSVTELKATWKHGIEELEQGLTQVAEDGKEEYLRILALGRFINHSLQTLLNIKLWWQLRRKVENTDSDAGTNATHREMRQIAENEMQNVIETIEVIKMDSRLGWEPTMGYLTDESRLSWKIRQLERVLKEDLAGCLN